MFSTSSWQDRCIQNDVFSILKQLDTMGGSFPFFFLFIVLVPVSAYTENIPSLLQSFFHSYTDSFFKAYPILIRTRCTQSLPVTHAHVMNEAVIRRNSACSQKSYRRKKGPSIQSAIPSNPDVASLLQKRNPQAIWLEQSKEKASHEFICIWDEEKHRKQQKVNNDHFQMNYYACRCSMCSENQVTDETEDLIHFIDFLISVVIQPNVDHYLPSLSMNVYSM